MILLFKVAPDCSAEVLSSDPEYKTAAMCLIKKMRVRYILSRHEL